MTTANTTAQLIDLVPGCEDRTVALDRARELLTAYVGPAPADRFWIREARVVLATLLHAAAHDDTSTVADVLAWVAAPKAHYGRVRDLLADADPFVWATAERFARTHPISRDRMTALIVPVLIAQQATQGSGSEILNAVAS